MLVRTLERSDVRAGFSCGEASLDAFLERYAWQNQTRHHLGVTYAAVDDRARRVVGYFTIAAASLSTDGAAARLTPGGYREIAVLRVARLAVDIRVQGIGLGSELLHAALRVAFDESGRMGCAGLMVDARPDATGFYERFGFRALRLLVGGGASRPRPVPMWLSIGSVRKALG
jgi:predicted N-acetyltransferase YhbS